MSEVYYVRSGETVFIPWTFGLLADDQKNERWTSVFQFTTPGGMTYDVRDFQSASFLPAGTAQVKMGRYGEVEFAAPLVTAEATITLRYRYSDMPEAEHTADFVILPESDPRATLSAENQAVSLKLDDQSYTVDMSGGLDWVYMNIQRADDYWFPHQTISDGVVRLESRFGGTTTITGAERLQFYDGVLALDIAGAAGQAYRLYQAAFERTPDNDGLKYWIGRLDSGSTTLEDIADSFLHAPEFVSKFGTPETVSNDQFVDLLYTHTLGRDYDLQGYNYWAGKLDAGETNRGDLLAYFSESNENKARVLDAISDGIWLT